jgi:hypothetical protein
MGIIIKTSTRLHASDSAFAGIKIVYNLEQGNL